MLDLKEICADIYTVNEFDKFFNEFKTQRAKVGVSDIDVMTLGDFLDETVFNSLRKFVEGPLTPPEGIDEEDWRDHLKDIASLSGLIVTNNNKLNNLTVNDMYDVDIDNIKAENYAYRVELMDMLNEIWEYLYV